MIPAASCRSIIIFIDSVLRNNSAKLTGYLIVTLCCALLLSATFGQHYDESKAHEQGSIRKPRQVLSTSSPLKDPYASRPRIQTRNGHLLIEASQDKNIDFKTSGSRGSITINGYKLDRLLDVTKALEKSAQIVGAKTGKQQSQEAGDGPYDLVLRGLFESGERFVALEKRLEFLNELITKLKKKLKKIEPRLLKKVSKLTDNHNSLVEALKRNDCFDQDTGQPVCKNGATCLDTYNGFKCLCPNNYEGATCEQDIDECAKFRNTDLGCQNGAKCVNLPGSYRCECTSQYHGVHCTEQHDDCALSSSKSLCGFGKCISLARSVANQAHYECVCDQGWTTDGVNPACMMDINECLVGQSSVISLSGSPNMSSNSVQTSAAWSNSLMAAYPCSQNPFVDCINLPGSFQCGPCPPGYAGNGRICRDLDECAANNGGCSMAPLVECINTQGSRRCGPCPPGYTGDGLTCKRETACSVQPNGGCHLMAKCIELEGVSLSSRLCVCKYPFVGEGVGVDGCQPLPASTGPAFGSGGNNTELVAAQQVPKLETDCSPNPCLNMATYELTDSSFECLCPTGFQGKICDEQVPVCGGRFFFSKGSMSFPQGGSYQELVKMNSGINSANNFKSAATISERHYNCNWSITVSSNMSTELVFSELSNKLNPSKQVQLFLANTTLAHQIVTPPACAEYLDVRERLEVSTLIKSDDDQAGSKGRLLGRFCTDTRPGTTGLQALSSKRPLVIMSESNMVDLEYSFAATRTQFGEPSLSFTLNWSKKEPPCGGLLPVSEFGSLSSPKFPDFYPAGTECRYIIRVPPGKRVRIQFGELTLLTGRPHSRFCSDLLAILDGSIGSDRAMIFKHCGNNSTFAASMQQHSIAPIISSSSTVELVLASRDDSITPLMKPKQQRGFYLTYSSEPASPGCGGLYTLKSAIIKSADYEPSDQPVDNRSSRLAVQMSGFLDPIDSGQSASSMVPKDSSNILTNWFKDENQDLFSFNSSRLAKFYKTRCEYEIRPADQLRNNKISLDWLEMPTAMKSPLLSPLTPSASASTETPLSKRFLESRYGLAFPSRWSLLDRCAKGRLTVFEGGPSDGSGRTEIASFCAGDMYNASAQAALKPIISSCHVLYLVYESSQNPVNASTDLDALGPNGFKLHYSTVCHAIYRPKDQQSGRINVDLDSEVGECIYHIVLPPNNTISLRIEPKLADSTSLLANDGTCLAQAIFLDGAIQWNSSKQAMLATDRQLKTYRFTDGAKQSSAANNQATRAGNTIDVTSGASEATGGGPTWPTGDGPADSYWQYPSSLVHDMKEFEVCRLPALSFDSIWNHLSLLFRLKQKPASDSNDRNSSPKTKVQLIVQYQAEPSCGGIITDSPGSIKLE